MVVSPVFGLAGAGRITAYDLTRRVSIYRWFREHLPAKTSVALCKETKALWDALEWQAEDPKCNCAL